MVRQRKIIGVMGSGKEPYAELARAAGEAIAAAGYHLLPGAGRGVMAEAAKAYTKCERMGLSIGVVRADPSPSRPLAGMERAWKANACNEWVELAINTHLPASSKAPDSRNHINVLTAHALVFLPGGPGTESELELAVEYGRTAILFIGSERVNGRSASQLTKAYPAIHSAVDKSALMDLFGELFGPACG